MDINVNKDGLICRLCLAAAWTPIRPPELDAASRRTLEGVTGS